MELNFVWLINVAALLCGWAFVFWFLKRVNEWYYVGRVGKVAYPPLPPGDMGWPFLGNMLSVMKCLRAGDPNSFIYNLVSRYGKTGIYKTHLLGSPTVIVCTPELCRLVLTNEEHFEPGYPKSMSLLAGRKSLHNISNVEHRLLRRLITNPISGHQAQAIYIKHIEEIVINSLDEWACMNKLFELFTEMKRVIFKVMTHVFMGSVNDSTFSTTQNLFYDYFEGLLSKAINIPGFTFHKAFKARKELVKILQSILDKKRMRAKSDDEHEGKKDMMDLLMEVEDEDGQKFVDEDIVIDEMLRTTNLFVVFREAKVDISMNGSHTIPKGWKVLVWFGIVHMDPDIYESPQDFNPSRWDTNIKAKRGTFLPFGAGSRTCPGNDLAKLVITIFLHYFLLNYKLKQLNPKSPLRFTMGLMFEDNCLAEVTKIP
ncbi:hypothetical protein FH972_017371 [Carpinus fangiana]|uniref:Cytochrome P450 n=1 Tax=Carpinus fangiana TaxID=176857 RepID=A0A5N6RM61_9ROSI|nr:hypothetical protein FH972_017371 [Carpinus fangiana]